MAAEAIQTGEVVAYPTETVYGLGVNPFNVDAIERLFAAKERDAGKPVLLIVADMDQLAEVIAKHEEQSLRYAEAFWPGPLSLLFQKSERVPDAITAGSGKVCVRCPSCEVARRLCRAVGHAITSTSANLSGEPPARSLAGLDLPGVAVAIDGGTLQPSPPSTVFDPETRCVLREGTIAEERLLGL
jgi:L-threonylcarbamoyladenylate synthase